MKLWGALYLTTAASIWGGTYVASKYVLDYIPPVTLLVMRLVIAGLILMPFLWASGWPKVKRRHRWLLVSLGFVGFTLSLGLQFWGTKLSTAHNGGLITSASPALITLFAVWLLKERLTWVNGVALALASAGVLAVIGPETGHGAGESSLWLGNLMLLGAAVTWALYTVLSKIASRTYSTLAISLYATWSGVAFTLPIAYTTEWHSFQWASVPGLAWWGVAYVGVLSTAVAVYFWVKGFALLDASAGSLFFFAQPLVAAVLGWLLLGETLHGYFFVGAGLIFAGLAVSALRDRMAMAR
jgi:drug/metabolite transporter (DMT)-like permease